MSELYINQKNINWFFFHFLDRITLSMIIIQFFQTYCDKMLLERLFLLKDNFQIER